VYSSTLEANVPGALRDPDSGWFGLSWRPLVIAYDPREVDAAALHDYAALAAERWHGRLCLSTSNLAANRQLLASLIVQLGEQPAERTVRGWVSNLASGPFASAEELAVAIADDRCDVGIVDTGAFAGTMIGNDAVAIVAPVDLYAIVAAAGVTRHATNPDGAAALLEWLSADAAQGLITPDSAALPVNPRIAARRQAQDRPFPPVALPVAEAAGRFGAAALLAERAGYD
jgi:iron(III) transport system substrate-binding protein